MTSSHDREGTPAEGPGDEGDAASVPPADEQIIDTGSRADVEGADPDAGPTATAEQVERDSERDQAEG